MAVPKKKTSKSKRDMRRAHDGLSRTYAIICQNCGEPVIPHRVCTACGYYKGRKVLKTGANQ
ncbi:MAG: 50S ribosomal protein L32 [SAR324 cluster bacterium]|uniref:Large ribosomal subunit protein bL32 n=1 Tax=SAR324 cluster bacterium TaxID=2024889 RepID=A0A7X9FNX3_9DELT|nr:50S ribosomal protein L32 [SAR324 cluster bacterium]